MKGPQLHRGAGVLFNPYAIGVGASVNTTPAHADGVAVKQLIHGRSGDRMPAINTSQFADLKCDSNDESAARHRRWLRRGCWIASLLVGALLIAVICSPSIARWQLERQGWEIEFHDGEFRNRVPRFFEPWFADGASVSVSAVLVSDQDFRLLARIPRLMFLSIDDVAVSNSAFASIAELKALVMLSITRASIDGTGLAHLGRLPNLKHIKFQDVILDEPALVGLSACRHLQCLQFEDSPVADEHLSHLSRLPELTWLVLHRCQTGDHGLEQVAKIPELNVFLVISASISDDGVRHLRKLPRLKYLDLRNCAVTNLGVTQVVQSCRSLQTVGLSGTQCTDAIFPEIAALPELEWFCLLGAPITPDNLRELKRSPWLKELTLGHDKVDAIGPKDWEDLKRAKPNLQILFR